LAGSAIAGRTPRTGMLIAIDEVFFHCAKALRRARLWDATTQVERSTFPSLGRIIAEQTKVFSVEEAERRTEDAYRTRMY